MHRRCSFAALFLSAPLAFAALEGCAAPVVESEESGEESSPTALQRAVEAASAELLAAELELKLGSEEHGSAGASAISELDEAKRALELWKVSEAPAELEKARLELLASEMGLHENEEELAQLELMYAEQDLADKTRELVLARTQRRLEQSKLELALARREFDQLSQLKQPAERATLEAAVAEKQRALESALRTATLESTQKRIAVLKAKQAVDEANEALAEAKE